MGCGASAQSKSEHGYPKTYDGYELLKGKCYYKSGWCEVKGQGGFMGFGAKDVHLWIQCIHWIIYTYDEWQWWYNWASHEAPKATDMPSGIKLPSIPGLPKLPGMPDMPDMPSLSMPSMSMPDMPSMSMPSMSMPDMPSMSMPSMGRLRKLKKERREHYPWSRIVIGDWGSNSGNKATVERSGKKITLKNVEITEYWKEDTEEKKDQTYVFEAPSDEQAISWYKTIVYGGCKGLSGDE